MGQTYHKKSWFRSLSARVKLLLAFTAVSGILGAACIVALLKMGTINGMLNKLYERELIGLSACKEANTSLIRVGRALGNVLITEDPQEMRSHQQRIGGYLKDLEGSLEVVKNTTQDETTIGLWEVITAGLAEYTSEVDDIIDDCLAGNKKQAGEGLKHLRVKADELDDKMTALCQRKEELAVRAYEDSDTAYAFAFRLTSTCLIGGVVVSLALGWWISRWFTLALLEVDRIAQALSAASDQLASAAEELSSGAQEQASSLEETAASLEEITSTVQQNADNAQQANQLSSGAREVAQKGGNVTQRAVAGMSEINAASNRIADIITTIDEIAFQTNLLALNAAVEAARAGEQGRGFAVVAGEVRNLAQRSAASAKEIKSLIQDSVEKVGTGSDLVNQSGETLEEIVSSVKRVTDIVGEIAAASKEQATGIEQVNRAITEMDHVTQNNASQTEELSSTAEALAEQARHLQEVVDQFHLTKKLETELGTTVQRATKKVGVSPVRRRPKKTAPRVDEEFGFDKQSSRELQMVGAGETGYGDFEEF